MNIEITIRIGWVKPEIIPILQEQGFSVIVTEDGTAVTTVKSLMEASNFIGAVKQARNRPPK